MWKERLDPTQCPVCRALLGNRDKNQIFSVHCKECRATFTWKARAINPTVFMDSERDKGCNCGNCGR